MGEIINNPGKQDSSPENRRDGRNKHNALIIAAVILAAIFIAGLLITRDHLFPFKKKVIDQQNGLKLCTILICVHVVRNVNITGHGN